MTNAATLWDKLFARFLPSLIFVVVLPLTPLGLEYVYTAKIDEGSLAITVFVLSAAYIPTSSFPLTALIYAAACCYELLAYGTTVSHGSLPSFFSHPWWTIGIITLVRRSSVATGT